jgi:8-oxo-dGTP pyrophosphatase MutT (NUDIX family)
MIPAFSLKPSKKLTPADAVAALIRTSDGRYLLQHRDAISSIFYPDHWGCFGGALEAGEEPLEALRRELHEELAMDLGNRTVSVFGQFDFRVDTSGIGTFNRIYYDILIDAHEIDKMRLGEGAGMALLTGDEALHQYRMVPYDGFALWLHYYQDMLGGN